MSTAADDFLKGSLVSAALNSLSSVSLSAITFSLNAFILRTVSREALGLINVRLLLLSSTILFFSREPFRRSCVRKPSDPVDWKRTVNLLWLQVPLGGLVAAAFTLVWSHGLEAPPEFAAEYPQAVLLVGLSAFLELLSEPFSVVSQILLYVKFRSSVEFASNATRALVVAVAVYLNPDRAMMAFAFSTLMVSSMITVAYALFCHTVIVRKSPAKVPPFRSLRDFLPDRSVAASGGLFDRDRLLLTLSFFKQGLFKQLLTEGERYMFTWFNLMTLAEQGVYDAVAALGSLVARLIFSKVEESAYFYFSQTVTRGDEGRTGQKVNNEVAASRHLFLSLRAMTLIGLTVAVFGQSYSHLLLHLYGGDRLSQGLGPLLLRGQSVFVLMMALNGVSECYAFAAMSTARLERYNFVMAMVTGLFLMLAYGLSKAMGPIGFIVANCCNFAMRLAHSCYVIRSKHLRIKASSAAGSSSSPLRGMVPRFSTLGALAMSGIACKLSEIYLYDHTDLRMCILHVAVGSVCFLLTLAKVIYDEDFIRIGIFSLYRHLVTASGGADDTRAKSD